MTPLKSIRQYCLGCCLGQAIDKLFHSWMFYAPTFKSAIVRTKNTIFAFIMKLLLALGAGLHSKRYFFSFYGIGHNDIPPQLC